MDEENKITPESQFDASTGVHSQPEVQTENSISRAYREAQTKTKAIKDAFVASLKLPEQGESKDKEEEPSIEELVKRSKELTGSEEGGLNYLIKHRALDNQVAQKKRGLSKENRDAHDELSQVHRRRSQIKTRLHVLDRERGIKKLVYAPESRRLKTELERLQAEQNRAEAVVRTTTTHDTELTEQFIKANKKQLAVVEGMLGEVLKQTRDVYLEFYDQAANDPQALDEATQIFCENFVFNQIKEGQTSEEEVAQFKVALFATLASARVEGSNRQALSQKLDTLTEPDSGLFDIRDKVRDLVINYPIDKYLRVFLSHVAASDVSQLGYEFKDNPIFKNVDIKRIVQPVLSPSAPWHERDKVVRFVELSSDDPPSGWQFSERWFAIKNSPTLRQTFAKQLDETDMALYKSYLDKALEDTQGSYIDSLGYYPTPEAIRTLVIIASANSREYRTVHANWALLSLANKPSWPQTLEAAQEVYPGISQVTSVLENWDYNGYSNNSELEGLATDLIDQIIKNPDSDSRLVNLAIESLRPRHGLKLAQDRGILGDGVAGAIEDALNRLNKLDIHEYYLNRALVVNLQLLSTLKQGEEGFDTTVKRINRLGVLAGEILLSKPENISSLTDGTIIELVQTVDFEREDLAAFFEVHKKVQEGGLGSLTLNENLILARVLFSNRSDKEAVASKLARNLLVEMFRSELGSRQKEQEFSLDDKNWRIMLAGYSALLGTHDIYLNQEVREKFIAFITSTESKNFLLQAMNKDWNEFLKNPSNRVPFATGVVPLIMSQMGAGPLSQLAALANHINSIDATLTSKTTAERTKTEILASLRAIEQRFLKERWDNESKTDFYNISNDIIKIAPSLYSEFAKLFSKLNPTQLKRFTKDLYPLYRAQLVLLEKKDSNDKVFHDPRDLAILRRNIAELSNATNIDEHLLEGQRKSIIENLTTFFKAKFGVTRIPEEFSEEHLRTFSNITRYLASINKRDVTKENILGFYMSLVINGKWDEFRRGNDINPDDYLTPDKSAEIKKLLEDRARLNNLTSENLGIPQEAIPELVRILQQETQNQTIASVETIDIKLNNVILNLNSLEDLDLYTAPLDKSRMELLLRWGNKKVGSTVAKMYQQVATPSKGLQFADEEAEIRAQIEQIAQNLGLTLDPKTLKEQFQDGMKPFATVVNILQFTRDTQAQAEIDALREILNPPLEAIEIFNRLGEDFRPNSGALPLSQDINYLRNLIVKREDEISPTERDVLKKYLEEIQTQVIKLEGIYEQIKTKFGAIKQGVVGPQNSQLNTRLSEIDGIINAKQAEQSFTSTATTDLNVIIENMRQCLSCTKDGFNNDTNLSFGDANKFYLYSQAENQTSGSISDQIVFFESISYEGKQEMAFIMDTLYGTNTPTVLQNQVLTVAKKVRFLKQRFPQARVSIFVTQAALTSGGTSENLFTDKLRTLGLTTETKDVEVNVAPSAFSDQYIEFGGESRNAGKRTVHGMVVRT